MSGGAALIAGTLLAVGALAFVLYPLFFSVTERTRPAAADRSTAEDSPILALREIEFDRATGKLSDSDYAELKTLYGALALRQMRDAETDAASPQTVGTPALDDIEVRVRQVRLAHRSCPDCGVRPEPDALYCSTCGGYLDRVCPQCKSDITESSAAFCSKCGTTLAQRAPAFR